MRTVTTFQAAKAKIATPTEARMTARSQYGRNCRVIAETIDWYGSTSTMSR